MTRAARVTIVSSSPIIARGMGQLLEREAFVCEIRTPAELGTEAAGKEAPDVALISPQSWEELATWLPLLRSYLSSCPWLMLAEPQMIGMFITLLEYQPCLAVDPDATPAELVTGMLSLASGERPYLPAELLARFSRYAPPIASGRFPRRPTPAELQCGCAVSLGLSTHQMAAHLHIGPATAQTHLNSLMRKLGVPDRNAIAAFMKGAFHPSSRAGGRHPKARTELRPLRGPVALKRSDPPTAGQAARDDTGRAETPSDSDRPGDPLREPTD